jgi:DNA helicase-2/ATP-dependent DNA helicase PcrA
MDQAHQGKGADALLDALDPEQREVASTLLGPLRVLAGAGTGKTRAITHRIAYGVRTGTYNPASVLAVTFTSRAAGEMRERLRSLGAPGVQARTFHAAALRQLGYFLPKVEHRALPRLVEHKAPLVAQAAARLGIEVDRAAIRDLASEIEWTKLHLWTSDDYQDRATQEGREPVAGCDAIAMARLIHVYEQVLAESEAMDFEDVLLATCGLLVAHPRVAEEVRAQYRHFVVDEYQDVSPVQQRLLDLWLGGRNEVCVVGDPNQTIYSFAGASAHYLTGFEQRYPNARTVELVRDYRSTPQVVSLANSVLLRGGDSAGVELVAQRPSGPPVAFKTYADDVEEATGTVARLAELINSGVEPNEIAILYRTNGQSEPFETALTHAQIGYQVRGGEKFFSRQEVRQAIVLLRGASKAAVSDDVLYEARELLRSRGWSEQAPVGRGAVRERWESLDALAALVADLVHGGATTLAQVVAGIDERAAIGHTPVSRGVTLASLHAAKGLEWDAVFLVGLSEGLVPISLAIGPEEIAEERRLLYVGITRAREHLALSYARSRNPGGAPTRKPSRFLDGLWPTAEQVRKRVRGLDVPKEAHLSAAAKARLQQLKKWRDRTAKKAGCPAFTVMTDVTLLALADRAPQSNKELVAIPGIGPVKLELYGQQVLNLLSGKEPR